MTTETQTTTPKKQMSLSYLTETGQVMATFVDNSEPLYIGIDEVPEDSRIKALVGGIMANLRGATSKLEGENRTPANLRTAIAQRMTDIRAGQWTTERAPGEAGESYTIEQEAAWLFRKLKAEAANKEFTETLAEVAELWDSLTDDPKGADGKPLKDENGKVILGQKGQVKATPRYQQALAQIKARRAAEKAEKMAKKAAAAEDVDF